MGPSEPMTEAGQNCDPIHPSGQRRNRRPVSGQAALNRVVTGKWPGSILHMRRRLVQLGLAC